MQTINLMELSLKFLDSPSSILNESSSTSVAILSISSSPSPRAYPGANPAVMVAELNLLYLYNWECYRLFQFNQIVHLNHFSHIVFNIDSSQVNSVFRCCRLISPGSGIACHSYRSNPYADH